MKLSKVLNLGGNVLAIAGIVFLVLRFRKYAEELSEISLSPSLVLTVFCLACISGLSVLFLVAAWKRLLNVNGETAKFKDTVVIYGVSQLAKYIPGNVFQFAGRQMVAMQHGMSARAVAKSIGMELLLLVFCGCIFTTLMLPSIFAGITPGVSVLLFVCAVGVAVLTIFFNANICCAIFYQCLFLMISGVLFYVVLYFLDASAVAGFSSFKTIATGFIVAWLIGLVTPGAPAGIGVREAVLIVLLSHLPQSEVIAAAIISRVVTLVGDVLFYSGSLIVKRGVQ